MLQNDKGKGYPDNHINMAEMNMYMELFQAFEEDGALLVSADDMNNLTVGGLAVSRYHRIKRFFRSGDGPNHDDHNFLTGYKIKPSG
jgi:hypothetical protein